MRFTLRKNGTKMVTMKVEHTLGVWDVAAGWVYGGDKGYERLPESKRELEKAVRFAFTDNPIATQYIMDDTTEKHMDAVQARVRELYGLSEEEV